jgi:hypothetical protein
MLTERGVRDLAQTIVRSRELCAGLAEVIADSRRLCGRTRQLVHPRIRGGSEADELAASIRIKIDAGLLPRKPPAKIWAGQGTGQMCAACDLPIQPDQVEYEFEDRQRFRMHLRCAAEWQKARRPGSR